MSVYPFKRTSLSPQAVDKIFTFIGRIHNGDFELEGFSDEELAAELYTELRGSVAMMRCREAIGTYRRNKDIPALRLVE
jgi:hypothetical protein